MLLRIATLLPIALISISPSLQFALAFSSYPPTAPRAQFVNQRSTMQNHHCSTNKGDANNFPKNTDYDMKVLGICGGIGSGKSTACKLMVDALGCVDRIDADLLAHDVYEPGSQSLKDIVNEFGEDILSADSKIDRKKLGSIVFSDDDAMSRLEQIVWPHVRTKLEDRLSEIKRLHQSKIDDKDESHTRKPNKIVIVEAALLLETNWHDLLDGLWVIQSSQSVAVKRLKDNRGLTEKEALTRIQAQQRRRGIGNVEDADRMQSYIDTATVTAVITNDGTLAELQSALETELNNFISIKRCA